MASNRIGSKQIEERLGRSGVSSDDRDDTSSSETSSNDNMLFACLVVVLLIVGAGIGFAASGRSAEVRHAVWEAMVGPPPYVSRVADTCDKGWKDDRFNRDQIHCHMTKEVARLCEPRERRALVERLYDYQAAMDRSDARLGAVALQMIANPGAVMAMGMAEARSRDPNSSEKERADQFDKTVGMAHDIMSPVEQIDRDNLNTATKAVLVADVKRLAEHGYLAAADFSSPPPKIVKEGLAAATHVSSSYCQ